MRGLGVFYFIVLCKKIAKYGDTTWIQIGERQVRHKEQQSTDLSALHHWLKLEEYSLF